MTIQIELKNKSEIKKEKDLSNGIYAVWLLGFINGTLFVSMIITFHIREIIFGLVMFMLWVITLPPMRKEKFIEMWKEKNKNGRK